MKKATTEGIAIYTLKIFNLFWTANQDKLKIFGSCPENIYNAMQKKKKCEANQIFICEH